MRHYIPLAQMSQEQREKYQAKQKRTKKRAEYQDKEQRRNSERHAAKWKLDPASSEIVIIDGEADETGHYYLFQAYTPLLGMQTLKVTPPKRLGLFGVAQFLFTIKRKIKKMTGKRAVFVYFACGYDLSQQLYGEPKMSDTEKEEAWHMRSKQWGAVRGPDFKPELLIAGAHKALYIGRKTGYVNFLADDNLKIIGRVEWEDMFTLSAKGLVKTIEDWAKFWSPDEHEEMDEWLRLVRLGKSARGHWASSGFTDTQISVMYQEPELKLMHWYARTVITLSASLGLAPRSLAGPAPMARSLAHKFGVTAHIKPETYDTPEWQSSDTMMWIRCAYYGGRIELAGVGEIPEFHAYDISSAYPTALLTQPCMAHGHWETLTAKQLEATNRLECPVEECALYEIHWKMPEGTQWGPFPIRDRNGKICFPLEGWGIYHDPEIMAFLALYGDVADYNIIAGRRWVSDCYLAAPFRDLVETTYQQRGSYKQQGKPEGNILKLALNSFYGVTAQTSGAHRKVDETGRTTKWVTPKLSNTYLAGRITSTCRATIIRMVAAAGQRNVFAICTDAIKTFEPVDLSDIAAVYEAGDKSMFPELGSIEHEHVVYPTRHFAPGKYAAENGHNKVRGIPVGDTTTYWYDKTQYGSLWEVVGAALSGTGLFVARTDRYQNPYQPGYNREHVAEFIPSDLVQVCGTMGIVTKRDIRSVTPIRQDRTTRVQSPIGFVWCSPYEVVLEKSRPIKRPYDIRVTPDEIPEIPEVMVP